MRKKIYFSCFILLSQITSCYQSKKEVDFISSSTYIFSSVNCFEDSIEWGDILEQKEDEYFAYIYSETCYYCNIIKPKICHFCGEIDEKMYFIKFDESIPIGANFDDVIGADSLEKLFTVKVFSFEGSLNFISIIFCFWYKNFLFPICQIINNK